MCIRDRDVPAPHHYTFAVRDIPEVTIEQRERALNATHWNEFAFPAAMLTVDMLSDSGTTAMTNHQWASLFLGDEAYGRNTGYYVLLDTFRDIFERGGEKNWKKIIDLVRTDCRDVEKMMNEVYLCEYEGGLFNGGAKQMERPNAFIIQQGRAAESVLMEIVRNILARRYPGKKFTIPSNGHFDTTEGNIKQMGSIPRKMCIRDSPYGANGNVVFRCDGSGVRCNRGYPDPTVLQKPAGGRGVPDVHSAGDGFSAYLE